MSSPRSSIERKVMAAILLTSVSVLALTCTAFILFEVITFRETLVEILFVRAQVVAANSTAALAFQNDADATDVLSALRSDPHMVAGALYDASGRVFARYPAETADEAFPRAVQRQGHLFDDDSLTVFHPVTQGSRFLGTVYLESDLSALTERYRYYTLLVLLVVGASVMLAVGLSFYLKRHISAPILALVDAARDVTEHEEFSLRAQKVSDDEVGLLVDTFNQMLGRIEARDSKLTSEVAERRAAEIAARNAQTRLEAALEVGGMGTWIWDLEEDQSHWDESMFKLFDRTPEELGGEPLHAVMKFVHPEDRATLTAAVETALENGELAAEYRIILPSGKNRWIAGRGRVERDDDGRARRMTGACVDVTAQKRSEAALRRVKRQLETKVAERTAELSDKNDELEAHAEQLRETATLLQEANEELQQSNEELEEQSILLTEQKLELEVGARRIAQASRYKSEFLANMSHELRTPLNSLLILSKVLTENRDGNLTDRQVEYASTIHSSGNNLLALINDILDLSKIEAGTIDLDIEDVRFDDLVRALEQTFRHVAENSDVEFHVRLDTELPPKIDTDLQRLQQILTNLLSNAFKFTEEGSVAVDIGVADGGWERRCSILNDSDVVISFAVTDSGIGIPRDKQEQIFEAFQQADAGTARKYGGTGLGLSICRELARLLGGTIELASEPGRGSSFVLYLPGTLTREHVRALLQGKVIVPARPERSNAGREGEGGDSTPFDEPAAGVDDDRQHLEPGDLVLLIIEDDADFASTLTAVARQEGFKAVTARTAGQGLSLAAKLNPAAITLDLRLPDRDGWVVLDRLKHDPQTRHVPVHVVSVFEESKRCLKLGAFSFLQKPVGKERLEVALRRSIEFVRKPAKKLLVVEPDASHRDAIVHMIGNGDVETTAVGSAADALHAIEGECYDCFVIDPDESSTNGADVLQQLTKKLGRPVPPIVLHCIRPVGPDGSGELRKLSRSVVVKGSGSLERLFDQTALFLHRRYSALPDEKRHILDAMRRNDAVLAGRKVLVVDDDVRNIFAITAALENYGMEVCHAFSGNEGIDFLQRSEEIEAVLMDIMMPDMDGYEAIRRIRRIDRFEKLPIISVTAKAMKGDRDKSLRAGASDYITKPVDMDQLRSLLRVWLYR